jgi:hypothetical protein
MRVYCQLRKYFIYLVVQSRDPDEEYSIAHGTLNRAHVVSMKQDLNQSSKQLWEEELGGSDGHQVGTTRIEGGAPWTSAVAAAGAGGRHPLSRVLRRGKLFLSGFFCYTRKDCCSLAATT